MKTIFVTGGAGLIGSCVAQKLIKEDWGNEFRVVVLDQIIQYLSPFKNLIKDYMGQRFLEIEDKVIFERGDTGNLSLVRRLILKYKPDYILHLAAMPIANLTNINIEEAINSIYGGAVNVMEVIRNVDFVEKFVYVSSSMVYGDFKEIPCPETHPKNPKDIYGGSKYAGEVMTRVFSQRFGIPFSIVRPSAVYGPYDINRRVGQIYLENAFLGKPLRLDGGGKLMFDFTYVDDIAQGLIRACIKKESLGEDFNITYGRGYSLLEMAEVIKSFLPKTKCQIVEERDIHRPLRGALSIEKAKNLLGYSPNYPIEEGMEKYVNSYKKLGIFK